MPGEKLNNVIELHLLSVHHCLSSPLTQHISLTEDFVPYRVPFFHHSFAWHPSNSDYVKNPERVTLNICFWKGPQNQEHLIQLPELNKCDISHFTSSALSPTFNMLFLMSGKLKWLRVLETLGYIFISSVNMVITFCKLFSVQTSQCIRV